MVNENKWIFKTPYMNFKVCLNQNGSSENKMCFLRGSGRLVCNHNVLYYLYAYFTKQVTRKQDRAVDMALNYESKGQWLKSQAGLINMVLFVFHLR